MKGAKFLTVFLCAFLVFGLNIASAKPPQTVTAYGEAVFVEIASPRIIADKPEPYVDTHLPDGEDQIEVELNKGNLEKTTAVFGRHCMVCWPDCEHSTRGVVPDFSISPEDEVHAAPGTIEGKMLDALTEALGGTGPESICRFRVRTNTLGKNLQIRVDSVIWGVNWEMLRDDKGIGEEELIKYFFFSGPDCSSDTLDDNTLQYNLRYEGVNIVETDPGKSWTIEPFAGPATLYVFKGQSRKKGKPTVYSPVDLVTYTDGLPFKIETTISDPSTAPGRYTTLTTCWGDIKGN
jgi:hypothetical protein